MRFVIGMALLYFGFDTGYLLTRILVEIKLDSAIAYDLAEVNVENYIARGYSESMVGCITNKETTSGHFE